MNKIFVIIIIFSFCFGIVTGNIDNMSLALLQVPKQTITSFISLFSIIILYTGLINVAKASGIISKLSKIGMSKLQKLFKGDKETIELISVVIWTNLLGLGLGNLPISLQIINNLQKNKKELITFVFINISSMCLIPISLITLRVSFNAKIIIPFIPLMFLTSLLTTIIAYFISRKIKVD